MQTRHRVKNKSLLRIGLFHFQSQSLRLLYFQAFAEATAVDSLNRERTMTKMRLKDKIVTSELVAQSQDLHTFGTQNSVCQPPQSGTDLYFYTSILLPTWSLQPLSFTRILETEPNEEFLLRWTMNISASHESWVSSFTPKGSTASLSRVKWSLQKCSHNLNTRKQFFQNSQRIPVR